MSVLETAAVATPPVERDWRFAELVMRTWTEPELAASYQEDPCGTFARFGLHLDTPEAAPALRRGAITGIEIEDLDHGDVSDIGPIMYSSGTCRG